MRNPFPNNIYLKRSIDKPSDMRGAYFRDQTAIIHSMAFRRLKHKTQVFFAPENDHICTRIEHVMHVATIAKTICQGLNRLGWNLDVELAFAIGLGHDLGHAPFGHDGETVIHKRLMPLQTSFMHEIHSYRIVEQLANKGKGLNLTYAVKDGIITHNGERFEQFLQPSLSPNILENIKDRNYLPTTYEGCIVRFSDKIAYLGRDIEDAITANFIRRNDIPALIREKIGNSNSNIINTFVNDIIDSSKDSEQICLSNERFDLLIILRNFNYKYIYHNDKRLLYKHYADKIINSLFDYLLELYHCFGKDYPRYEEGFLKIPLDKTFGNYLEEMDAFYANEKHPEIIVADYIAGMTDLYALDAMKQISIPSSLFHQ